MSSPIVYKAILFDFDGTLVPSLQVWLDGFRYAFGKLGLTPSEESIIEGCFYREDVEIAEAFKLDSVEVFWQFVQEYLSTSEAPALFSGAKEVLDYCADSEISIGLVTSSERDFVEAMLEHLQIGNYFSVVVTANDTKNLKPHPEPVMVALAKLKANPKQTLFIGDNVVDVLAGREAGTHTALFYSDFHKRFHNAAHMQSSQPSFMFSSYGELLELLNVH